MQQTQEQIERHYAVEKELADMLRQATSEQRQQLYPYVYDELYKRVPDHPMLTAKEAQAAVRETAVARKIKMLRGYLKKHTVYMEIGAGDCLMSIRVAPNVAEVIAVEVSAVIAERTDLPDNMSVRIISRPFHIPVSDNSVHLAYSDQLAEHLHPDDFHMQCENIYKSLAPGGKYVIVTPNRINGPHDVSRGFDKLATGMHLKEYTYTELHSMMKNIGFSNVQPIIGFKGFYCRTVPSAIMVLESVLEKLPAGFSRWLSNTLPVQMLLAIRLLATK